LEKRKMSCPFLEDNIIFCITKQCVRVGMDSGGLGQPYGRFLNTVLKLQVP
jgi:hypothetical protein